MSFQRALVTGATSGIGYALVVFLQQKGLQVTATGRDPKVLEQLQQNGATIIAHDLLLGCEPIIQYLKQTPHDLIIHAAGFGAYGPVMTQDALQITRDMLQVHVLAALELTIASLEIWKMQHQKGTLLHISSFTGELPMPGMALYGASKACLTHLCQALDFELSQTYPKMRVLVACPGMVQTPFAARATKRAYQHRSVWMTMPTDQVVQEIWQQILKGKRKVIMNWKYRVLRWMLYVLPQNKVFCMTWRNLLARCRQDT